MFNQFQARAQGAGQHGGRCRGKHIAARGLHQPVDQRRRACHKRTGHPSRLAQRGHVKHARRGMGACQAELRQRTAPLGTQHTKPVRIIQQQQRIKTLGQVQQARNIGNGAVHAEDRVAHDEFAWCGTAQQLGLQHRKVSMGKAMDLRP